MYTLRQMTEDINRIASGYVGKRESNYRTYPAITDEYKKYIAENKIELLPEINIHGGKVDIDTDMGRETLVEVKIEIKPYAGPSILHRGRILKAYAMPMALDEDMDQDVNDIVRIVRYKLAKRGFIKNEEKLRAMKEQAAECEAKLAACRDILKDKQWDRKFTLCCSRIL